MSLRKTIVFLPPYLVTRYDRLAAKYGISRSEALRVAVETSYDTVRQLLASRTTQRRQESPAGGEAGSSVQGALAALRTAAALVICGFRGKPITDSGRNRSLIPIQTDHRFRSKPITFSRG